MSCVCWDLKHHSNNIQGVQRELWWRYYSSTVGQSEGDASGKQVCSKCNKHGRKVLTQRQVRRTAPCLVFTAPIGRLTRMQIRLNKHAWDLRVALEGLRELINAARCNKWPISTVRKRARGNGVQGENATGIAGRTRGWKEENNTLVQRQLIWNSVPNHRHSQHFTLIFCLSNNLLQNSTIDLQSTQSFLGKIHSWLHHRHWLDTTDEKPDGSNHLQPGGRRIEKFFSKGDRILTRQTTAQFFFALFHLKEAQERRRVFGWDHSYGLCASAVEYAVWKQQMCQSPLCVYLQRQVNFSFCKTSHRGSPQFLHVAEGHCKKAE